MDQGSKRARVNDASEDDNDENGSKKQRNSNVENLKDTESSLKGISFEDKPGMKGKEKVVDKMPSDGQTEPKGEEIVNIKVENEFSRLKHHKAEDAREVDEQMWRMGFGNEEDDASSTVWGMTWSYIQDHGERLLSMCLKSSKRRDNQRRAMMDHKILDKSIYVVGHLGPNLKTRCPQYSIIGAYESVSSANLAALNTCQNSHYGPFPPEKYEYDQRYPDTDDQYVIEYDDPPGKLHWFMDDQGQLHLWYPGWNRIVMKTNVCRVRLDKS